MSLLNSYKFWLFFKRRREKIIPLLIIVFFAIGLICIELTLKPIATFVEAQTCLKVDYAVSRLTTIAEGLRNYQIKNKSYPKSSEEIENTLHNYIEFYFKDRCGNYPPGKKFMPEFPKKIPIFEISDEERNNLFVDPFTRKNEEHSRGFHYYFFNSNFIIWSIGPDRKDDLSEKLQNTNTNFEFTSILNCIYDPSNGVVSPGDIVFSSFSKNLKPSAEN